MGNCQGKYSSILIKLPHNEIAQSLELCDWVLPQCDRWWTFLKRPKARRFCGIPTTHNVPRRFNTGNICSVCLIDRPQGLTSALLGNYICDKQFAQSLFSASETSISPQVIAKHDSQTILWTRYFGSVNTPTVKLDNTQFQMNQRAPTHAIFMSCSHPLNLSLWVVLIALLIPL